MEHIIEKYLGNSTHQESGNSYYQCPVCNWKNPRLSVSYEENKFHCWKCGWGGKSLSGILFKLNADKQDILEFFELRGERRVLKNARNSFDDIKDSIRSIGAQVNRYQDLKKYINVKLPEGYKPLHGGKKNIATIPIRQYLSSRGISSYEIKYYDIHYNLEESKILIPSYDTDGRLNFYVSRTASKKNKWYENPHSKIVKKTDVIFFEYLIDPSDVVIITEGVFDAMKIGYNALPILGSFFNQTLISFLKNGGNKQVILAMDKDAIDSMIQKTPYFLRMGIEVYMLDYSKTDEGDDPASLSKETLRYLLQKENLIKLNEKELMKRKLTL